jgi:hypothetical protein
VISSTAQVACLVAGSLQALGPAAPMAQTWNQYWVPLVRPVTVQHSRLCRRSIAVQYLKIAHSEQDFLRCHAKRLECAQLAAAVERPAPAKAPASRALSRHPK